MRQRAAAICFLIACTACSAPDRGPDAAVNDSLPGMQPADTDQPMDTSPAGPDPGPPPDSSWMAGPMEGGAPDEVGTLRAVRTARHDGYDRIVFDFGSDAVPGYRIAPLESGTRATRCGSGEPVALAGEHAVEVTFIPAGAHTEEGAATVTERSLAPELPAVRALELVCDFEAHVVWAVGLSLPPRMRARILSDPNRLILDIAAPESVR